MSHPVLSILTPSIPRRKALAWALIQQVEKEARGKPVEHLVLVDNVKRSIGLKRQALLDAARGEWVTYVDDDDEISDDYVDVILEAVRKAPLESGVDVINFPIRVTINGEQEGVVLPSLAHEMEEYRPFPHKTKRKPHELSIWRASLAKKAVYQDTNVGEDFAWARQLWPLVRRELNLPTVIYHYKFEMGLAEPGVGK
jgi:glycosyltransferase involved in cell wall biosynthesis